MKCVENIKPRKKIAINNGEKKPQRGQKAITKQTRHVNPRNVAVGIILGQYTDHGIVIFLIIGNQNVK